MGTWDFRGIVYYIMEVMVSLLNCPFIQWSIVTQLYRQNLMYCIKGCSGLRTLWFVKKKKKENQNYKSEKFFNIFNKLMWRQSDDFMLVL